MIQLKYDKPEGQIYQGNALEVLRSLPDESVNCCVTSPPYWGLRNYGTDGQVWGGLRDCEHDWGDHIKIHKGGPPGNGVILAGGRRVCKEYEKTKEIIAGQFCKECGAWFGCLGLEPTPGLFVKHMVEIFAEVLRVLRSDGTLWLNLGDSYATQPYADSHTFDPKYGGRNRRNGYPNRTKVTGLKHKDLVGAPWRVAMALQADGWYLRQDIIWHKPNPMPESVKDRCTKAHEYIFLLSKSQRYYYDMEAIKEPVTGNAHPRGSGVNPKCKIPNGWDTSTGSGAHGTIHREGRKSGAHYRHNTRPRQNESYSAAIKDLVDSRNKRSVWTVTPKPFKGAHFATFPPDLIDPCVLAGCPRSGTVLDPFFGSGTTGLVAYKHDRKFIGIDLSEDYLKDIAIPRIEHATQQLKLFN